MQTLRSALVPSPLLQLRNDVILWNSIFSRLYLSIVDQSETYGSELRRDTIAKVDRENSRKRTFQVTLMNVGLP